VIRESGERRLAGRWRGRRGGLGAKRRRRRHAPRVLVRPRLPGFHSQSQSHSSKPPTRPRQRSETTRLCYFWPPPRTTSASLMQLHHFTLSATTLPPLSFVLTRPLLRPRGSASQHGPQRCPEPEKLREHRGEGFGTLTPLQLLDPTTLRGRAEEPTIKPTIKPVLREFVLALILRQNRTNHGPNSHFLRHMACLMSLAISHRLSALSSSVRLILDFHVARPDQVS